LEIKKMPTILDIARLSGVSKSTVSRVLNHHPHVSPESQQKVREAIKALSYVPNSQAVHLRLQTTKMIGIVVPVLDHPFFSQLVSMLTKACRTNGYKVVVHQTFFSKEEELAIYEELIRKEMDALILTYSTLSETELKENVRNGIVVVCNEQLNGEYFDVVGMNEGEAICQATIHLLESGLRNLVFCCDDPAYPLQQKRWSGFKRAHEYYGLSCHQSQRYEGILTIQDGIRLGEELFHNSGSIEGIIAGSDFVAAGLLSSAKTYGINVPDDVKIIGFDNHPICLTTTPPLTSLSYPFDQMTHDVMACLTKRLRGDITSPANILYKAELVVRGTS
jgi:LacI family transcriptional regulator, repressor for deo operon, udp, cdd, tsx, nupC, and nupG